MNPSTMTTEKKIVLYFYLGLVVFAVLSSMALVLRGQIGPGVYLSLVANQIIALGALLIKLEGTQEQEKVDVIEVEGDDVTVTETSPKAKRGSRP